MDTVNRSELKEKYGDEDVLIVERNEIEVGFPLQEGFSIPVNDILGYINNSSVFAERWKVEYNPPTRQPIPYILIQSGELFFATRRKNASGEARLHGQVSLGVGGHINPVDDDSGDMFENAMLRELHEELILKEDEIESSKFIGVINDNSSEVSQDHIALVYLVKVKTSDVKVKEVDKLVGKFYTINELLDNKDKLESWSQIVLDMIIKGYIK